MHKQIKIFGTLITLDLITTYIAFTYNKPSGLVELNPLFVFLFPILGILLSLLILKGTQFILMWLLFNDAYRQKPKLALIFIKTINIFYILVVINNIIINTK